MPADGEAQSSVCVFQVGDLDAARERGAGRKLPLKCERCFGGDDAGREASCLVRVFGFVVGDGCEIAEIARGEESGALGWIASLEQT